MIAIVPGYISRSVAGSYDNEGIAIFCMLLTYYLWIKAVKTGAILWSTMSALAYFYMVSIHCPKLQCYYNNSNYYITYMINDFIHRYPHGVVMYF